jgi:GTP-binding protein
MSPATSEVWSAEQIEAGRLLFARPISFARGVARMDHLPDADRPETAFAGRSNVGKSSLINMLANRRQLARASNTPGRTQELNFFDLGEGRLYLVDLPGYGFAEASKKKAYAWGRLMIDYLKGRPTLKRVFLLIDGRRGVGDLDIEIMDKLDASAVIYQVVLTKVDKLRSSELAPVIEATRTLLKKRPASHPRILVTSSETGEGAADLRAEIAAMA